MPRGRALRNKNGYGTIVKLSGKRRKPYEVRVNTHMDERNYPAYDVLGRFEDRETAAYELAQYNHNPYDINARKLTFEDVYKMWYVRKYEKGKKKYSQSSIYCTKGAYKHCAPLYKMKIQDIKTMHMQYILDNYDLSHAYMEHIQNLFKQIMKYALEMDYIDKDYASFTQITKDEDDIPGVPFTQDEIDLLWAGKDKPYVDTVLILIYSGWRISELLKMPLSDIDLEQRTFLGGLKTAAGKNRIVPIHSKIYNMVVKHINDGYNNLFGADGKTISDKNVYYKYFDMALKSVGIATEHTPHDCRHTCATLLDNAGANSKSIKLILGHSSGNDVTEKIYTHKDIEELRRAIELI